jgi:hypothetical protein
VAAWSQEKPFSPPPSKNASAYAKKKNANAQPRTEPTQITPNFEKVTIDKASFFRTVYRSKVFSGSTGRRFDDL